MQNANAFNTHRQKQNSYTTKTKRLILLSALLTSQKQTTTARTSFLLAKNATLSAASLCTTRCKQTSSAL